MPVSGLVITMQDGADTDALCRRIAQSEELALGERHDRYLPVALDARDDAHSREVHDWLMTQPGVAYVDVVAVNFEEDVDSTPN